MCQKQLAFVMNDVCGRLKVPTCAMATNNYQTASCIFYTVVLNVRSKFSTLNLEANIHITSKRY